MIESWEIAGGALEYIDETHTYIFDGVILPSITQILKSKFGNKYNYVSEKVLNRAAIQGTMVHKIIEDYEKYGIENEDCKELRNYKFLKKNKKFKCLENEVPVVLFLDDKPVSAGRIDMILEEDGSLGIGDIKRTSTLDKEYVAYQTNLYRIAYEQTYNKKISFLRVIHLRNDVRKYVNLPIEEDMPMELIKKYKEENNE